VSRRNSTPTHCSKRGNVSLPIGPDCAHAGPLGRASNIARHAKSDEKTGIEQEYPPSPLGIAEAAPRMPATLNQAKDS
jgi:hypothetical protein